MNPVQNVRIAELLQNRPSTTVGRTSPQVGREEFSRLFEDRLKISGHAQTRLDSRNIELGKPEWERVLAGVDKAAAKGSKESLVLVDDVALVVSVKNRTVITAVDRANLKDNVFTNIDSAVVV
ncbi:MAG: hypothetical protein KIS66_06770 [Fimbriimonadaceae bacterium]|nr:hypothetical protein [Fimbriimonadaceae bacterium]